MPVNIIPAAIPVFLLLTVAEIIHQRKEHKDTETNKGVLASIGLGSIALLIAVAGNMLVVFSYSLIFKFHLFTIPDNVWWAWVLCFFADDFSYYWYHRMSHQIRFFWASHAVHHSSEIYSLSGGLRLPWTAHLTGVFLFWGWMPLLGLSPMMVIWFKSVSVIYQFWLHTETIKRMPKWFEMLFNTPHHHRIRHASNNQYLDKNHAGTLIIWDKIFGTYISETVKPVYGLCKKVETSNPVFIAFHEWKNMYDDFKKAKGIKDYLNYTFNSPGWSNDGSSKTARQIQKDIVNKLKCSI